MHALFQRLKRRHEFWLASVIAVLVIFLSVATQGFLTLQNLFDLLTSYAFLGILAAGLLVVLISGGIDISFTATASIAQYITMLLANKYGLDWFSVFAIAIVIDSVVAGFCWRCRKTATLDHHDAVDHCVCSSTDHDRTHVLRVWSNPFGNQHFVAVSVCHVAGCTASNIRPR